ncbi:divalent-cation tolerance protein CutA [Streptomyces chromofuscus]|uniref:Divalent-cation tolerance protein CutA n=1 Tax=Streptomyces chromofuscus TaxID=42881 RepID=A0A7M2T593_STRCW|nr:divalent-cation tolerance protein CutA [Streptomyces chromofuscus]QOV43065.1 divalent-cation tolerance protein CutA [Streptomyces chromofuscus]GGS93498.1 divalent cation tolerance protein [Streptomyces chromofuscus]
MATEIVIAQTTIDDEDKAKALALGAVEARLAACAHVDSPFTAVYRWKGNIETAQEWRISYKTTTDRLPELSAWVAREHSYEVPEWITLPVTGGSEAYLSWVVEESAA